MLSTVLFTLLPGLLLVQGAPSNVDAPRRRTEYGSDSAYQGSGDSWQSSSWQADQNSEYQDDSWDQSGGGKTIIHETTITTAASSYETPQYGSGSWGSSYDYNSCVQVCQAQWGSGSAAPTGGSPTTIESGASQAASPTQGGVATHTIIVAPSQGVLRFVPFAVTANEGDVLHYIWGAGPHTVTLSDGQNVCNKSTTSLAFDSGKLNATQTFDTTVKTNGSSPSFYYCTVGPHCTKGMFGLINPPTTNVTNNLTDVATATSSAEISKGTSGGGVVIGCKDNSVDCWVEKWKNSSPQAMAKHDGVKSKCSSVPAAWSWGGKWDMSQYTTTIITKEVIVENVMYSRLMLATNPVMLQKDQPFPAVWTAPPELDSFLATVDNSTTGAAASGPDAAASSAVPSASDIAAGAVNANGTSTGAASIRIDTTTAAYLVGLVGLIAATVF